METVKRTPPTYPYSPSTSSGRRAAGALWFGVLTGPMAFLANEQIEYALVSWSCGRLDPTSSVLLHLVPLTLFLITAAAGVVAWRHRTMPLKLPQDVTAEDHTRPGFVAVMGVGLSVLLCLSLIAQWLPVLYLGPSIRTWGIV